LLPSLLSDANVALKIVRFLRGEGVDVRSLSEEGLGGLDDEAILELARAERRFVLTHDRDFGRLAVADGVPLHGILYLRPGDRPPEPVIDELRELLRFQCDWTPPLIAVYRDRRLRLRRL